MQANEPERKLAAIWVADVVGYSRMMGQDEAGTLTRWQAARRDVIDPAMKTFRGRLFKEIGDGLLAEFPSAVMGLRCALHIQQALPAWNEAYEGDQKIQLRIGVHQGEVIVEGSDLLGDGVNVAARLEPLAPPGGICVSDRVREDVSGKLELAFDDLGQLALKNIGRKVRVHSVRLPHSGDGPLPTAAPPLSPQVEAAAENDLVPHNLPEEASSFIGREELVRDICAALVERRRLTLVGSGGVGKTRIALRVGMASLSKFRDGVWLVELAPLADAGAVGEAICRAVSAPVAGARSPTDIAVSFLRQKNLLLILDNCEHVLAPVAELASVLLARCPEIAVLATSREPLRITGEIVYRLPSLPVPTVADCANAVDASKYASVCLFVQRSSDAIGGYALSDGDAPHVGAICRRLDGVAMAIELAAARMTVLKPAEIKQRLDNAFRLLNTGSGNRLPRHQTLWATIDWSHSLLSPQEQIVLRRLSVFVDGFSLDGAVAAVAGDEIDPDDVLDLISLLVDKSLINTDKSGLVMRYRMLEATRHYAREKLKASGETGRDRRAADYLAGFYERAEASWPTTPTEPWLAEFGPEVENLRAAIDWAFGRGEKYHAIAGETGDPILGVTLVARAGGIASEMSLHADIRRWTTAAMPHLEHARKRDAAWVLYWDSKWKSNFGTPIMPQNRALAIAYFREARDVAGLSCALRTAALAIARPGDVPAEAETMLSEAVALLSGGLPDKHLAWALEHMAILQYFKGDLLAARSGFEDVTAMRRRLGDRTGLLGSMINLAELDFVGGAPDSAIVHAREAEAESRRAGSLLTLAHALGNLTGYLLADARVAEARQAGVEALRHYRSLGQDELAIQVIEHLALAHALDGTHHTAARLLGCTEAYFARTSQARDPMEQAGYLRLCALLLQALPGDVMASCKAAGAVLADDAADAAACCDGVEAGVVWAGVG